MYIYRSTFLAFKAAKTSISPNDTWSTKFFSTDRINDKATYLLNELGLVSF